MYNPDDPNNLEELPPGWAAPADQVPQLELPAAPQAAPGNVGHDGSFNGQNREQWRDAWMGSGQKSAADTDAWMAANGATKVADNGTFRTPHGEVLDLGQNYRTGNVTPGWTVPGGGGGAAGALGGAAGVGGAAGAAGGAGGDFQGQIRSMLMQMLSGAKGPVDENSTEIAQPYSAAKLAADRSLTDERKALAERLYAEGGGSGSNELTQGIQQSAERNAVGLAGIKSQLIQRVAEQKHAQLQQALQLAVQSGDAESARAIQLQIAQMSAALQSQGLAQSASQFAQGQAQSASQWNDKYGLESAEAQYQRDRDAARAKAGLPF